MMRDNITWPRITAPSVLNSANIQAVTIAAKTIPKKKKTSSLVVTNANTNDNSIPALPDNTMETL